MPEKRTDAIIEAMLEACGELGYTKVRIEDVTDRWGGSAEQLYEHFDDLAACFEAAYAVETDRLIERILKRGAGESSWRRGFGAALRELAAFAQERPAVLRALLQSAHLAGERTRNRRTENLERLSRALDSARREPTPARHSPPPLTALFMVSAIEAALVSALVREEPEAFLEMAPELERLVFAAYFGD